MFASARVAVVRRVPVFWWTVGQRLILLQGRGRQGRAFYFNPLRAKKKMGKAPFQGEPWPDPPNRGGGGSGWNQGPPSGPTPKKNTGGERSPGRDSDSHDRAVLAVPEDDVDRNAVGHSGPPHCRALGPCPPGREVGALSRGEKRKNEGSSRRNCCAESFKKN